MTWLQLRLEIQPGQVGDLEERLLASGAVAVTLEDGGDQPLLEPGPGETPLWDHTRLTGLYPADTDMRSVLSRLPDFAQDEARHRVEILEDKDWEREWMQHYAPMQFGPRLWVCPSWIAPPAPDAINLMLDPGLAFGTGTHPTTALCLGRLDELSPADCQVVDYGCGSGILALAALKLGAHTCLGVDTDPQALVATRENAARNAIPDEKLSVALPGKVDRALWSQQADLVVANILAGPLVELSSTLLGFLKPGGTLLLSGLLDKQAATLCRHYEDRIRLDVAGETEGWVCLQGKVAES